MNTKLEPKQKISKKISLCYSIIVDSGKLWKCKENGDIRLVTKVKMNKPLYLAYQ